ncbi:MAG: hypothetical protein ACXVGO_15400, partial [Mycobacterium sp.]
ATPATKGPTRMPINDLSGLSGLDDKRRAVLAQKLEITNCYDLIMADRQRIVDAFGRRANRPTLEDVAVWQDEARRLRAPSIQASVPVTAASGWEPTAMFVVAFEQRRQGNAMERRIVAEQTEIEPEASPQQRSQWPGWAYDDACRWMLERVGAPTAPTPPGPAQITSVPETGLIKTCGTGTRSKIEIERANLADSSGDIELVAGSRPVPQDRLIWTQPAQLAVTLGAPTGPGTSVVLQLIQSGGRKQSIVGHLDDVGRVAKIQLSGLADGEYKPTIAAWTPEGSSLPRVVKLPTVEVVGSATGPSGPP